MRHKHSAPTRRGSGEEKWCPRKVYILARCGDKKSGATLFVRDYHNSNATGEESYLELQFKRSSRLAKGIRLSTRRRLLFDPNAESQCNAFLVPSEQYALEKLTRMLEGTSSAESLIMYESTPVRVKIHMEDREMCNASGRMKIPVQFSGEKSSECSVLLSAEELWNGVRGAEEGEYYMIDKYMSYKIGLRNKGEKTGIYVEVKWSNGEITWEPAAQLYSDDPVGVAKFLASEGFDVEKVKVILEDGSKRRGRLPSWKSLMKKHFEPSIHRILSRNSIKRSKVPKSSASVQKRPRSRPRKYQVNAFKRQKVKEQELIKNSCSLDGNDLKKVNIKLPSIFQKRSRGKPPKRKYEDSNETLEQHENATIVNNVKRPRGRPRKHLVSVPSTCNPTMISRQNLCLTESRSPHEQVIGQDLPGRLTAKRKCFNAKGDSIWLAYYEKLKEFQTKNGHCFFRDRNSNMKLYTWITQQRHLKKVSKMNDNRIKMLDDLGFEWVCPFRPGRKRKAKMVQSMPNNLDMNSTDNQENIEINSTNSKDLASNPPSPKSTPVRRETILSDSPSLSIALRSKCMLKQKPRYIRSKNFKPTVIDDCGMISLVEAIATEIKA